MPVDTRGWDFLKDPKTFYRPSGANEMVKGWERGESIANKRKQRQVMEMERKLKKQQYDETERLLEENRYRKEAAKYIASVAERKEPSDIGPEQPYDRKSDIYSNAATLAGEGGDLKLQEHYMNIATDASLMEQRQASTEAETTGVTQTQKTNVRDKFGNESMGVFNPVTGKTTWKNPKTGKVEEAPAGSVYFSSQTNTEIKLSDSMAKEGFKLGETLDTWVGLVNTFEPEYSGYATDWVGATAHVIKEKFGTDAEETRWWRNMESQKARMLSILSGAQVSDAEMKRYEKTLNGITPGMHPDSIKAVMDQVLTDASRSVTKWYESNKARGMNEKQLKALIGEGYYLVHKEDEEKSADKAMDEWLKQREGLK